MIYGTVCSGVEAASLAWEPLGWRPAFFSEIDKFQRAVLKHHWPHVPLHGDFTTIKAGDYEPIDLLAGGTPCQSFSVAGLRKGLDDDRGNLALEFLRLAERLRPRWLVWENVPGVLSSLSHAAPDPCPPPPPVDMGLDGQELETEDEYDSEELHALVCFLAGLSDIGYGYAYATLDAQYFGVPQRRNRIIVVGYLGDWRPSAAVLLEPESLRGDPPPRRDAGQGPSPILEVGARTGVSTDDLRAGSGIGAPGDPMYTLQAGKHHGIAGTLQASGKAAGSATQQDAEAGLLVVANPLGAKKDGGWRGDLDNDTYVPVAFGGNNTRGPIDVATAVNAHGGPHGRQDFESETFVAFDCKASGRNGFGVGDVSPTPRAMGHADSHQNAGGQVAVAFDTTQITSRENRSNPQPGDPCHPLASGAHPPAITGVAVRRLTPMECERLQGMPDNHTRISWRGKPAEECPDGPRYKAIGNSWAVPKFRYVGERIDMADRVLRQEAVA